MSRAVNHSNLTTRLALGLSASLLLHLGLLLSFEPGSEFFARARAPGKATDTRLVAMLSAPEHQFRADVPPAIIDTDNATSIATQTDKINTDSEVIGRKNSVPDAGIVDATGDQAAYFSANELDVRPVPVGEIIPDTPDFTGTVSGVVLLRVQINREGTVDRIIVVKAMPEHSFRPGTFWAFERAKFVPAMRRGIPVNSEILIEVRYGPDLGDTPPRAEKAGQK